MRNVLLVVFAAFAGCIGSQDGPGADDKAESTPMRSRVPQAAARQKRPSANPVKAAMTSEFKPYTAFRSYAAKVLKVSPEQIDGGATDEDSVARDPNNVGGAWAYTMWAQADLHHEVRGWVTKDGTVITPEQNLGRLFVEAGAWRSAFALPRHKPTKDKLERDRERKIEREVLERTQKLAERLIWSYGMGYSLEEPESDMPRAQLALAADGSGTFRFFASYRVPGPGARGAGQSTISSSRPFSPPITRRR